MGQAFDLAWSEISGHFGDTPAQIENARLGLAEALLSIAIEGATDVAALKAGALHAMAMRYRSGILPTAPKNSESGAGGALRRTWESREG
jgi:hypothetical protein